MRPEKEQEHAFWTILVVLREPPKAVHYCLHAGQGRVRGKQRRVFIPVVSVPATIVVSESISTRHKRTLIHNCRLIRKRGTHLLMLLKSSRMDVRGGGFILTNSGEKLGRIHKRVADGMPVSASLSVLDMEKMSIDDVKTETKTVSRKRA